MSTQINHFAKKPNFTRSNSQIGTAVWLIMMILALIQLFFRRPLKQFWQQQGHRPAKIRRESWIEWLSQMAISMFATMGLFVLRRPESRPMGWLMLSIGFISNLESFCKDYALLAYFVDPTKKYPLRRLAGWLQHWLWTTRISALFVFLPLLFPNGRLPTVWWRPFMVQVLSDYITRLPSYMFAKIPLENGLIGLPPVMNPYSTPWLQNMAFSLRRLTGFSSLFALLSLQPIVRPTPWHRIAVALYFVTLTLSSRLSDMLRLAMMCAVSAASLIWRWRDASAEERQQIKWLAYISTLASGLWSLNHLPKLHKNDLDRWATFQLIYRTVLIGSPIALGLAIMKYRLYDIDALIKRTLVYVPLTTLVIGLYSAIVSLLGKLFQRSSNSTVSSLIATGIVAVLFQPLREQLQNLVNRHLYGERDDPIGVITKLAGQVEDEDVLLNLLPTFIETIASLLKLPYVALQVADPAEAGQPLISTGEQPAEVEVLPLSYQGKQIGQLTVAPRAPGELFSQAEQRLLTTIAHLTATIVHTIQLTDALQESRLRVVTSREEERRRIRRDLHDGLGPTLASQTLKLDTLLETLADHPQIAMEIKSLKGQTQQMVADIRRLVYALRPPALDELGLLEALRAHIAQMDGLGQLQISIMAEPDPLPALPAALEVVTYRTTLEAVTNVIRHAAADHCQISFKIDSLHLTIIINDNGVGLPLDYTAGVGLISMRERAEELGGTCQIESNNRSGTQVMVTLPLINLREPK